MTTFSVATNHQWRDYKSKQMKKAVEFHNIVAWGKIADVAAKYLKKGNRIFVEGRLQTRSWQDKTGIKHARTEIVADQLIMLGAAKRASESTVGETELAHEEVSPEELPVT